MAQTRYKRPYSLRLFFAIQILLCMIFVVLVAELESAHPATLTVLTLIVVLCILATIFDPETAYHTKTTLNDGTVVRVKRPFIGFKHLETKVGVSGDYEVRFDGWRHEPALLRI